MLPVWRRPEGNTHGEHHVGKRKMTHNERIGECTCWEGSYDSTENHQHRVTVLT